MHLRVVVVFAATAVALVSAAHSGRHMWDRLTGDYAVYRSYTNTERRQAPLAQVGLDGAVFDWFAGYIAPGDRVYFQVMPSGLGSLDLPATVRMAGSYYLLPAVEVTDLRKATVVVSWLADPNTLHVHFLTQQRAGLQLMFVSRIRPPLP